MNLFAGINAQTITANYPYRTLYVIFPLDIFKSDYPDGTPVNLKELGPQTTNLLKYCKINHFSCIMFNCIQIYRPKLKIEHPCKETINECCASGVIPEGWSDYFALLIKLAKKPVNAGGYGLKSIGAELREMTGDELYGDTRCCISDLDEIIKFDKKYPDATIDQIDLDYEFDLPQYSKFKTDNPKNKTNVNGFNYNLDPFCNCTSIPADNSTSGIVAANEYVAFGFRQMQAIINYANKLRKQNPHTIDTLCIKIENMEENFSDDGTIPPMKLNTNVIGNPLQCRFPKDSKFDHCASTSSSRSLTQAIYFAEWVTKNVDKAGLDYTTADGTSCGLIPKEVSIYPDSNGCKTRAPIYFINNEVDNDAAPKGAINPPTINYDKPYYPFTFGARRQRWLDYFASVKTDKPFSLFPRFSTQPKNPKAGYSEGLGDWMTQLNNWDCSSVSCNNSYICCDIPHYLPDVEKEFMNQFANSFTESFNQFNKNLDHEGAYYYDDHYHLTFNHSQNKNETFWGICNNITINGFGWYRYGYYPLNPDNNLAHNYAPSCPCDPQNPEACPGICTLQKDRSHDADASKK